MDVVKIVRRISPCIAQAASLRESKQPILADPDFTDSIFRLNGKRDSTIVRVGRYISAWIITRATLSAFGYTTGKLLKLR
jgi:hypothetical protein